MIIGNSVSNVEAMIVSDEEEISRMISLSSITIPDQEQYLKGVLLVYNCSWD